MQMGPDKYKCTYPPSGLWALHAVVQIRANWKKGHQKQKEGWLFFFFNTCSSLKGIRDFSIFQRRRGRVPACPPNPRSGELRSNFCSSQACKANEIQGMSGKTWMHPVGVNPCRTGCCGRGKGAVQILPGNRRLPST